MGLNQENIILPPSPHPPIPEPSRPCGFGGSRFSGGRDLRDRRPSESLDHAAPDGGPDEGEYHRHVLLPPARSQRTGRSNLYQAIIDIGSMIGGSPASTITVNGFTLFSLDNRPPQLATGTGRLKASRLVGPNGRSRPWRTVRHGMGARLFGQALRLRAVGFLVPLNGPR